MRKKKVRVCPGEASVVVLREQNGSEDGERWQKSEVDPRALRGPRMMWDTQQELGLESCLGLEGHIGRLAQSSSVERKCGHVTPAPPKVCSTQTYAPHPTQPRYNGQASVHILLEPVAAFGVLIPPSLKHFLSWLPAPQPSPHLWLCLLTAPACQLWCVPGSGLDFSNLHSLPSALV